MIFVCLRIDLQNSHSYLRQTQNQLALVISDRIH